MESLVRMLASWKSFTERERAMWVCQPCSHSLGMSELGVGDYIWFCVCWSQGGSPRGELWSAVPEHCPLEAERLTESQRQQH